MPDSPAIYVDFDDVLCETALEFTRVLEREYGKRVAFPDIFSFDLGKSFDLSGAEVAELMDRAHDPDVLAAMEPVEGAVAALRGWMKAGYEVWILTGRPARTDEASRAWLEKHGVPYTCLQFVDKYSRPDPDKEKGDILSLDALCSLGFVLAVEDAPEMVRVLAERTRAPVAMLARPWNAAPLSLADHAAARVTRCRDWAEIVARFETPGRRPGKTKRQPRERA